MLKLKSKQPTFFDNTEDKLIVIPPCVLDNSLRNFEERGKYEKLLGISSGIFFPVLLTLVAAEFHNTFNISAAAWQGTFIAILIGSFAVMIFSFVKIIRNKSFTRKSFIDNLIDSIRKIEKVEQKVKKLIKKK